MMTAFISASGFSHEHISNLGPGAASDSLFRTACHAVLADKPHDVNFATVAQKYL